LCKQQEAADEIEDVFRAVPADIPAQQRAQIGDAVDSAGVALLADDQDGHHQSNRLGDDGEIDPADPPLEERCPENERRDRRHRHDRDEREGERFERNPEERQLRDLIPIHEIGNAGRRLDLGIGDARGF
jgi:hypothetical protein